MTTETDYLKHKEKHLNCKGEWECTLYGMDLAEKQILDKIPDLLKEQRKQIAKKIFEEIEKIVINNQLIFIGGEYYKKIKLTFLENE